MCQQNLGVITAYSLVVYLKFNLATCGFIFDTLLIRGSFRLFSVTHLYLFYYSNTFHKKFKQEIRSNTPLLHTLSCLLTYSKPMILHYYPSGVYTEKSTGFCLCKNTNEGDPWMLEGDPPIRPCSMCPSI